MKYNLRERCQINYNEAAEVAEQADAVGERARMRFCRQYRDQLNSELVICLKSSLKSALRCGKVRLNPKHEQFLRDEFNWNGRFKVAKNFLNSFDLVHSNFSTPLNAVEIDKETFKLRIFKRTIKYMDQDLNHHSIKSTYLSFKFTRINMVY